MRRRDRVFKKGDYVLATKWSDGDPQDQWCVGFYKEKYDHFGEARHIVTDNNGKSFRANGFRRVEPISKERGEIIVNNLKAIDAFPHSMWCFIYRSLSWIKGKLKDKNATTT